MELAPSFMAFMQELSATMTMPSFVSLTTILTGGVFAIRRTVTRMILAAGDAADKHFSSYHRLFSVLCCLPTNCDLTSRLVKDARLYAAPPERKAGTDGRPRRRGQRLPTPIEMLAGRCRRVTLNIYGHKEAARLAEQVAHVHAAPQRPLRVVTVEAVQGGRGQKTFYSTRPEVAAEQVIAWYAMRWSIEVMNHDSKQHLGFEEPQDWPRRAVERTPPMAMLLYSLIMLRFAREGHRSWRPLACPWYTSKAAHERTIARNRYFSACVSPGCSSPGWYFRLALAITSSK